MGDISDTNSVLCEDARCNTCKAVFSSIEKVKEHFRGDWHVFNSKRRANGLVPLSKAEYKQALPMIQKKQSTKPALPVNPNSKSNSQLSKPPEKIISDESNPSDDNKDESKDEEEEEPEDDLPSEYLEPNCSLFDNKCFESVDECVEYMGITYGFFIPDVEYLTDLEGFLSYLNEKVKIGHICLFCHRQFKRYRSCQNHMQSKSHCKIAYNEDVDMEEFEDFYDFTESYNDGDEEYDDDGNLIEKTLTISNIGELVLTDGRTLGHRSLRRYYKQRYHPEESRDSVLAYQREELLRLGCLQFGGQRVKMEELMALSDTQVMSILVQKQREIRQQQQIEQRARQKHDFITKRRAEYQSTVDKLRGSATTTQKIRDYHSRLV